MATVVVDVVAVKQDFPAGTTTTGIQIILRKSGAFVGSPVLIAAAPYTTTFNGLSPGDYDVVVFAVDAASGIVGPEIIKAFTIPGPPPPPGVSLDVPQTVTVTVS